jgi:hypothetical protein
LTYTNINLFFQKGPEQITHPSGKKQYLGYIARLIASEFMGDFITLNFKLLADYYIWQQTKRDLIRDKINAAKKCYPGGCGSAPH